MDYGFFDKAIELLNNDLNTKSSVLFAYRKKTGELRLARGTKRPDILTLNQAEVKGTGQKSANVLPYFDLNSKGWRCFDKENLVWTERSGLIDQDLSEEDFNELEQWYNKEREE